MYHRLMWDTCNLLKWGDAVHTLPRCKSSETLCLVSSSPISPQSSHNFTLHPLTVWRNLHGPPGSARFSWQWFSPQHLRDNVRDRSGTSRRKLERCSYPASSDTKLLGSVGSPTKICWPPDWICSISPTNISIMCGPTWAYQHRQVPLQQPVCTQRRRCQQ